MGIVFFPFSENVEVLITNQAYEKHFLDDCIIISNKRACFADLLAEVFEKRYLVAATFFQEVPYVLPFKILVIRHCIVCRIQDHLRNFIIRKECFHSEKSVQKAM